MENKAGLSGWQIFQAVLVALLSGSVTWLANSTLSSREEIVRMKSQLEERGTILIRMQREIEVLTINQQQVMREMISLKDSDLSSERRLNNLENRKP